MSPSRGGFSCSAITEAKSAVDKEVDKLDAKKACALGPVRKYSAVSNNAAITDSNQFILPLPLGETSSALLGETSSAVAASKKTCLLYTSDAADE